jgi:trans-feruloyl-CoA hydratase/vanillin synthase
MLIEKNPVVLHHAKVAFKSMGPLDWELADEYLRAKQDQTRAVDADGARAEGMARFLDDKAFRPGLETYRRS